MAAESVDRRVAPVDHLKDDLGGALAEVGQSMVDGGLLAAQPEQATMAQRRQVIDQQRHAPVVVETDRRPVGLDRRLNHRDRPLQAAQATVCMSRVKQLALGSTMYSQDNRQHILPQEIEDAAGENWQWTTDRLLARYVVSESFQVNAGQGRILLDKQQSFICPTYGAEPKTFADGTRPFYLRTGGYVLNTHLRNEAMFSGNLTTWGVSGVIRQNPTDGTLGHGKTLSEIRQHNATVLVIEGDDLLTGKPGFKNQYSTATRDWLPRLIGGSKAAFAVRHAGGGHFSFLDGSVARYQGRELPNALGAAWTLGNRE